jgi:riboflavin kinase/FMN adenylyltransferase
MNVHKGIARYRPPAGGTVLAIGNFDGVHLGHHRLINAALERARNLTSPVVAVTFDPHPLAMVNPKHAPICLTTCSEKIALLEACGVNETIVLRSDAELLAKTAEEFLFELVEHCRPRVIVEGPTFNFGRGRAGSVDTLRRWARELHYDLTMIDELHCRALPDNPAVNSSTIRRALGTGRLSDANAMLGRPYRIVGTVTAGRQRGASLGFPTANLTSIPHLLPAPAVYAGIAQLADGSLHLAAVNIGPQPTFEQQQPSVEAHLLDYSAQLRGQRLGLHLLARLRDQTRFADTDQLAAQIRRDVEQTRGMAGELARMDGARRLPI